MTDISTAITATLDLATKKITLASRLALYEKRTITIDATGTDNIPAGTYKLQVNFGSKTVAYGALSVSSGALTGTLNLSTTQLEAIFDILPVNKLMCTMLIFDSAGQVLWARSPVDVWRNEYDVTSATSVPVRAEVYSGVASIADGASSVTISLADYPLADGASLAGSVIVPNGSDNIFIVSARIDNGSAIFGLSSTTVGTAYKLSWMVAQ